MKSGSSQLVLVVDDDDGLRLQIQELLENEGFETLGASGVQAGRLVLQSHPNVDVVISDVRMRDGTGFDMFPRPASAASVSPAVIILTGYASLDYALAALQLEAVDLLQKPVEGDRLIAAVRRAVDRRRARTSDHHRRAVAPEAGAWLRDRGVRGLIRLREKLRCAMLEQHPRQVPELDMLLHIADAEALGKPISVLAACYASGLPKTSALRRLKSIEKSGLVLRKPSPSDRRTSLLVLTPEGQQRVAAVVGLTISGSVGATLATKKAGERP